MKRNFKQHSDATSKNYQTVIHFQRQMPPTPYRCNEYNVRLTCDIQ
jgi:hypothetical protein